MPRGFTLIELLIVIVLVATMSVAAVSIFGNLVPQSQLALDADAVATLIRTTQAKTISGEADDVWGVYFTRVDATQFKGSSYAGRDVAYDTVLTFADPLSISGLSEIVFEIRTGKTANTGTLTLSSSVTNESVVFTINENGRVER